MRRERISFISLVIALLSIKIFTFSEILLAKSRYEIGLQKLAAAADDVAAIKKTLEALQPKLIEVANSVAETVKQVEKEKLEAAEVERTVALEEALANEQVSNNFFLITNFFNYIHKYIFLHISPNRGKKFLILIEDAVGTWRLIL